MYIRQFHLYSSLPKCCMYGIYYTRPGKYILSGLQNEDGL
ncbi:hypothetical protein HMPREF0080_00504 [Anaeroglobus geminatus F0357]|uniref:Uncharacterized protein n=1 Tax=Anaeroglobus geminatus F0357 TaxID=861450 RepID=G9YFU3_9FIRM|nr:hypothetical protein HMPREF0080_00504 [Anaeroglobus geminatus F0357]